MKGRFFCMENQQTQHQQPRQYGARSDNKIAVRRAKLLYYARLAGFNQDEVDHVAQLFDGYNDYVGRAYHRKGGESDV